jgi:hypothetical protein
MNFSVQPKLAQILTGLGCLRGRTGMTRPPILRVLDLPFLPFLPFMFLLS